MVDMPTVPETTLRELMDRRAAEAPDHVYCTFNGRAYTFREIDDSANRIANGLIARGLRPGDRVALMLPGHPDHIIAILALAKTGLVRVPINIHLIGAALEYALQHFEPHALLLQDEYLPVVLPLLEGKNVQVVIRGGAPGNDTMEALMQHPDASPPRHRPRADDIIALTPSSGTTGAPKGVLKSDRTLRAGPMGILKLTDARPGDVFLFWEALHHGAGVAVAIAAVIESITLAMVDRFSASRFWDQAREARATHIHYLGGVLPILLKQPPGPGDRDHRVRMAWGGGCPPEVWQAFSDRFGVTMREGYGLSEMITFVCANIDGPAGSMGKPLSYYEICLTDDAGHEVPAGTAGEIRIRARQPGMQFLGYFRNDEAARATCSGDWLCTGDLARRDADGWLYFGGRKKDTLRRRGVNISAWEVERVVNDHPSIEECALIGVPSELGDDELKLFVRIAEGAELSPASLLAWSKERLPHFQVPRFIAFVNEFPRTPTQRIRKLDLPRSVEGVWDSGV